MVRLPIAALVGCLYSGTAFANVLESEKAAFEARISKLEEAHGTRLATLKKGYRGALAKLQGEFTKRGDLENTLAVRNEIGLLDSPEGVGGRAISTIPGLADLQRKYATALASAMEKHELKKGEAFSAYLGVLAKRKDELTRDRKIREAVAIRDEIARLRKSPIGKLPSPGKAVPAAVVEEAGPAIPKDFIVRYTFDKREEDYRVLDSSKNGLHARSESNSWTEVGKQGGGFDFSQSETIRLNHDPKLEVDSFTVSVWVNLKGSARYGRIWDHYEHNSQLGYNVNIHELRPRLEIFGTDATQYHMRTDDELPTDEWVHLAFTFAPGTGIIYVNGRKEVEDSLPEATTRSQSWVQIGRADAYYVMGLVDDLVFYGRALKAEEIKQIYQATRK